MRSRFALLLLLVGALVGAPTPVLGARPEPKVAVIVGPSGEVTARHRARAEAAIAEARRWTDNIAYVASPNATWPNVREALQGASIVLYLGHGNGWPSRYRDHLYPPTQNGLGLNPVAGVDDDAHQYFGEAFIREEVRLAPNAVVLLHHLCYASGNTEPGLPEGTLDEAKQRVDNYAAGFIAAGAAAVVADSRSNGAYYVRELLSGNSTIERIWRANPAARHNTIAFGSTRSPGFGALMDPDTPQGGYYRSLVARLSLSAAELRAGAPAGFAQPDVTAIPTLPPEPTLAEQGFGFDSPVLDGIPSVGGSRTLHIPIAKVPDGAHLPKELFVGVRWDSLEPAAVEPTAEEPEASGEPQPSASSEPTPSGSPAPTGSPAASGGTRAPAAPATPGPVAAPTPEPEDPAAATFVVPERANDVVTVLPAVQGSGELVVRVKLPATAGLYRLATTLHDRDGVAFDESTQALLDALVVRVQPRISASFSTPAHVEVRAAERFRLPVTVTNSGATPWADVAAIAETEQGGLRAVRPRLTAAWIALSAGSLEGAAPGSADALIAPAKTATLRVHLAAPKTPGDYLIVLDIVTADGSLTADGLTPGIVRVTVR